MTSITLHLGDCVEVMARMDAESVHAVVCDPPYNLSSKRQGFADCLSRVLAKIDFPHDAERDPTLNKESDLLCPSSGRAVLRLAHGSIREHSRVAMPEGAVHFERAPVSQQEIQASAESTPRVAQSMLPRVADSESVQNGGNYVLKATYSRDASFCDGACRCFTEPAPGVVAVSVVVQLPASRNGQGNALPNGLGVTGLDAVGAEDNATSEARASSGVVACSRTVGRAMLRLDLSAGTGELLPAHGTCEQNPVFLLAPAQDVRAFTGTSSFPPVLQPICVRSVGVAADRTFTVYFPVCHAQENSPVGFMGKAWDGWNTPASFQRWSVAWLREAFRILKPGGHLVAFGGSRTWHRLVCAAEDEGFEIRDSLAWVYGQGFPKSSNQTDVWEGWGTALKPAFEPIMLARKPLAGTVARNLAAHGTGALNIDATRIGTAPGDEVSNHGRKATSNHDTFGTQGDQAPGQSRGQVLGRWPANVVLGHHPECVRTGTQLVKSNGHYPKARPKSTTSAGPKGHTGQEGLSERFTSGETVDAYDCHPDCPVRIMDEQSGPAGASAPPSGPTAERNDGHGIYGGKRRASNGTFRGDAGGAARFLYQAKAANRERWGWCHDCGEAWCRGDRDARAKHGEHRTEWHPTVKPVDLMAWLLRLVVPPGGVVLDPFTGTGTVGAAALSVQLDAEVVMIEQAPTYHAIASARLSASKPKPAQPSLFE